MHDIATRDVDINVLKEEWQKFLEGKSVNNEIISRRIYESWKRSREYGIDPFKIPDVLREDYELFIQRHKIQIPSLNYSIENNDTETALIPRYNTDKFIKEYQHLYEGFRPMLDRYGLEVQLFDNNGRLILDFGYIINKNASAAEKAIGTNAASLAITSNSPEIVRGPEHYASFLHPFFCGAAPIHDERGEIIGAINVIGDDPKYVPLSLLLASCMAVLFDSLYSYFCTGSDMMRVDWEINKIIENIPHGIVCLDSNNLVRYYNKKILSILGITGKNNISGELKKHITTLNYTKEQTRKETIVDIGGITKTVLVTSKEIAHGSEKHKFILLEETKEQPGLHSNFKGNDTTYTFDHIVGEAPKLIEAKQTATKAAATPFPVLIYGESGTGKELFAQAIHNASSRKNGPFLAINCGAIPAELIESELFGYEPGAFTGALKNGKQGLLEAAFGGTLFLDEIESMPLCVQIKLLRALSTNKILKVGGTKEIPINVRIISATKKDLLAESDCGRFREDLYYRISTITVELPPLRERKSDIPLLVRHFVAKISGILNMAEIKTSEEFIRALMYYNWRGNVRELENVIERAIALMDEGKELRLQCLPERVLKAYMYNNLKEKLDSREVAKNGTNNLLQIGEEIIIETVLKENRYSLSEAAKILGIDRKTLYNKMHKSEKLSKLRLREPHAIRSNQPVN
ncbi:sigma-54 interaction domain-containing protein [Moorella sulfitireducens]|uniref:sigma-54 interaction domain-containing protein n=1 Tax=Neomoorella sulfitireducens TaxID=2972948 RepID=UPI0021AC65A3|nr:sigma 54-interacting transcriptional regulator [Moorella sulfitireducens]